MIDINEGEEHPTKKHPLDQSGWTPVLWLFKILQEYVILYGFLATAVIKTFEAFHGYKGTGWPEGALWLPCIGLSVMLIDRFKKCNRL